MKLILAIMVCLAMASSIVRAELKHAVSSVVIVLPDWANGGKNQKEPEGSGIVVGNGKQILTAAHVLRNATSVRIKTASGTVLSAKVVWKDTQTDVALLSIEKELPAADLSTAPDVGEKVCAIGNSFGLGLSVSCGVVSAKQLTATGFNRLEDFIQTDAAVNPGKSGGALVDVNGQIVGMLSAIFTKQSDANIGVNFAVSARLLKALLKLKHQAPSAQWPNSGIQLRKFPGKRQLGKTGAQIITIKAGSAAQKAGLKVGDVIYQFGTRRVRKPTDFYTEFAIHSEQLMPLIIKRKNDEIQINWKFNRQKENKNE